MSEEEQLADSPPPPRYHFEGGQYQDDVADLAAVLPPVLRPLQAGDAHVAPLEVLDVAAGAEKDKGGHAEVRGSPTGSGEGACVNVHTYRMQSHDCWYWTPVAVAVTP